MFNVDCLAYTIPLPDIAFLFFDKNMSLRGTDMEYKST